MCRLKNPFVVGIEVNNIVPAAPKKKGGMCCFSGLIQVDYLLGLFHVGSFIFLSVGSGFRFGPFRVLFFF